MLQTQVWNFSIKLGLLLFQLITTIIKKLCKTRKRINFRLLSPTLIFAKAHKTILQNIKFTLQTKGYNKLLTDRIETNISEWHKTISPRFYIIAFSSAFNDLSRELNQFQSIDFRELKIRSAVFTRRLQFEVNRW